MKKFLLTLSLALSLSAVTTTQCNDFNDYAQKAKTCAQENMKKFTGMLATFYKSTLEMLENSKENLFNDPTEIKVQKDTKDTIEKLSNNPTIIKALEKINGCKAYASKQISKLKPQQTPVVEEKKEKKIYSFISPSTFEHHHLSGAFFYALFNASSRCFNDNCCNSRFKK